MTDGLNGLLWLTKWVRLSRFDSSIFNIEEKKEKEKQVIGCYEGQDIIQVILELLIVNERKALYKYSWTLL